VNRRTVLVPPPTLFDRGRTSARRGRNLTVSPDVGAASAAAKGDELSISTSGDGNAATHGGLYCGKLVWANSGRNRSGDGGGILGSGFEEEAATYAGGGSTCSDGGRRGTGGASTVAELESEKVE